MWKRRLFALENPDLVDRGVEEDERREYGNEKEEKSLWMTKMRQKVKNIAIDAEIALINVSRNYTDGEQEMVRVHSARDEALVALQIAENWSMCDSRLAQELDSVGISDADSFKKLWQIALESTQMVIMCKELCQVEDTSQLAEEMRRRIDLDREWSEVMGSSDPQTWLDNVKKLKEDLASKERELQSLQNTVQQQNTELPSVSGSVTMTADPEWNRNQSGGGDVIILSAPTKTIYKELPSPGRLPPRPTLRPCCTSRCHHAPAVRQPDIQILYDSARSVNEVTNVATVQAKKHGEQAIEDNNENDLTQRNPRNVSDTIVALPKGSDVSCISESGVVDNFGEELLAAEVQEPSLCENTKAAPQLPENKIDSSLNLVICGTMGPSSTLVLPTNWDQITSSNQVFLENTVNSVFPINKEVLKMSSEVEKSGDFDPRVNDSSVEQSSALEVSAVAKEDFVPEKDNNNTNKEKDDSGQGLKVSPPKEDYVEIISDYEGDLRQSEESDETVVLDDDYYLSDLVVIDDDEDEVVEIVAGKPGRAWRMIEVEKGPSSTKTELFVHYKLSPHDGQPRKPVIPSETNNFTTRILLENNNITNKEKDDSGQGLKVSPPKEDYVEIISDYEGDLRQSEESDETVVLDDDDNLSDLVVIDDDDEDDGVEIVTGKPRRAWRMIEVEKGHSSTKTELFVLYKLSPHDGQPRQPVIPSETNNFTTRILLEPASVPPPVISNFGATMFGVPLDRSILNSGTNPLDSLPFLVPELESASTAARNERKRPADQEKSKRRQLSERLGVSDELWKPKTYKPVSGLTMEDQLEFNNRAHITDRERNLQAMGVIEDYGVLPRNQYQFPFDPYAGLYWPVFQPFDDIDLNDREETDAADVRNQLTDLTICNFIAKKELLCDADPGGWAKSFNEADRMTEAEREKNGRFANRVGFARKINNQNIKEARESDQMKQREHEARLRELEKMEAEAQSARSPGVDHGGDRLKATEARIRSMRMQDHVRENIVDEYSSVLTRHGNRKISQLPSYWLKVPREQYIPANDRRTFLCEFINHFNKGGVSFLNNLTRGGTELPSADAILYGLQKTVIEANYVHLLSARYQLRLGDMDLIYSKKRQKMLEKKFPIGSKVKIEELREFAKLQHWEQKYWTLIWDSLASAYKNIPPVSLLIDDILKPVDKAFLQLADSGRREEYHRIYRDHKEEYLRRTSTGRRF